MNKEQYIRIRSIYDPRTDRCIIEDSKITVKQGSIIGILGDTGSGKSTVLRAITGQMSAYTLGLEVSIETYPSDLLIQFRNSMAYIEQSPRNNIITRSVSDELFFSQMTRSLSTRDAENSINNICNLFNILHLLNRTSYELSEGEAQRVALAECLLRRCKLLLLDEPTAHLDRDGREAFCKLLSTFSKNNPDCVILFATHDHEILTRLTDSVYCIANHKLIKNSSCTTNTESDIPNVLFVQSNNKKSVQDLLHVEELNYSNNDNIVFRNVSLTISEGDKLLIIGKNGSGKSTLLRVLAGLDKRYKGSIYYLGKKYRPRKDFWPRQLYLLLHEPEIQIFSATLKGELDIHRRFWKMFNLIFDESRFIKLLSHWGIDIDSRTFNLSYGQKKILSMMSAFIMKPRILLLDDPFAGLDYHTAGIIMAQLNELAQEGTAICITATEVDKRLAQCYRRYLLNNS